MINPRFVKIPSRRKRLRQWPLPVPGMAIEIRSVTNGATAILWCASPSGMEFHAIVTLIENEDDHTHGGVATRVPQTTQELFSGLSAQGFDAQFIELREVFECSVADLEARRLELIRAAARGFDA